ncbi:MAG: AAA family ATPase [Planctomycetota bacterium]
MRIAQLRLTAFGGFTDFHLDLENASDQFEIVCGPNESGKSTTLRALSALLYGFPARTQDNYVHTNRNLRVGGKLIADDGSVLDCVRRKANANSLRGADDRTVIDEARMTELLFGVSKAVFETRYGLSHDELVAGGNEVLAGQGDLGQVLFQAGAGMGRLRDVQAELEQDASRLFIPRGSKGSLNGHLKAWDTKRKSLREAQVPPSQFETLKNRIEELQSQAEECEKQQLDRSKAVAALKDMRAAMELIGPWKLNRAALEEHGEIRILHDDFVQRRRDASLKHDVAAKRLASIRTRLDALEKEHTAIQTDGTILARAEAIEAAFQQTGTQNKAQQDRLVLLEKARTYQRRMVDGLAELTISVDLTGDLHSGRDQLHRAIEPLRVPAATRQQIRKLAAKQERYLTVHHQAIADLSLNRERLSQATEESDKLGDLESPDKLDRVIQSAGSPSAWRERIEALSERWQESDETCRVVLRRLPGVPTSLTIDEVCQLVPPSQDRMKALEADWDDARKESERLAERLAVIVAKRDSLTETLTQTRSERELPTEADLVAARKHRDMGLTDWIAALEKADANGSPSVSSLALELQRHILNADDVVDQIRTHQEEVLRLQTLESDLSAANALVDSLTQEKRASDKRVSESAQRWAAPWREQGFSPGSWDEMQSFWSDHQALQHAWERSQAEEKRLLDAVRELLGAGARLTDELRDPSSDFTSRNPPETDAVPSDIARHRMALTAYERVHADAQTRLKASQSRHQEADRWKQKREELLALQPDLQVASERAQRDLANWNEEWRTVMMLLGTDEQLEPERALGRVEQIAELLDRKRETEILITRIDSMDQDAQLFQDQVMALASAVLLESSDQNAPQIAGQLYDSLQSEKAAESRRRTLGQQVDELIKDKATLEREIEESESMLGQLCQEAGCDTMEELPELERRSVVGERLQARSRELTNQLRILAGNHDLDAFIEDLNGTDATLLDDQIQQQEQELDQVRERVARLREELGGLQAERRRIDTDALASELSQDLQLIGGAILDDAASYARLKLASWLLAESIEEYRQTHQDPVLQIASDYFRELTLGQYTELRADIDSSGKTYLIGVRTTQPSDVPAAQMSQGTADALYMAIRLASLSFQMKSGQRLPLIMDDCLVQLDDARAVAAMKVFTRLASETQVILLTHHEHLVRLAREHLPQTDFRVHQLEA